MGTQVQSWLMTAEELFEIPNDGFRYELVRGELRKMSPPGEQHGILLSKIDRSLGNHVDANKLGIVYAGEPGFKIGANPDTVRAPDVAFVSQERLDKLAPGTGYRPEAPDLVIEIISPSDPNASQPTLRIMNATISRVTSTPASRISRAIAK